MNLEICKTLVQQQTQFVPSLFTRRQVQLIEKYLRRQPLTPTEKTYFYSKIKQKIAALSSLKEEYYVQGSNMIPQRVEQAKKILKELSYENAFISGSFLYKKEYNDIDIYVISTKRKQYHQPSNEDDIKEKHFIFITPNDLKKPIFNSVAKYSIANFPLVTPLPLIKRPTYNDLVVTYEMAINEILENEDQKTVRELLFYSELLIHNNLLDAYSLSCKFEEVKKMPISKKIELINDLVKELFLKKYSLQYIYQALLKFIKDLEKTRIEYPLHDNLPIYIKLFGEIKNECRRA